MKKIITLAVLSFVMVFIAGCSQQPITSIQPTEPDTSTPVVVALPSTAPNQDINYKNQTLGFTLTFPQTWKGFYASEQNNDNYNGVCFSFKQPQPFCIFQIIKYNKSKWEQLMFKYSKNVLSDIGDSVIICDGCCEKDGDTTGGGQFNQFQIDRCKEVPDIIKTFKLSGDPILVWKTYTSQDGFLTFKYPTNLEKLFSSKQFGISIKTKQEIINGYEQFKDGGCPGACSLLLNDAALMQKQFDILAKMNTLSNCVLSTRDREEIKKDFILFTGGIGQKFLVEGIKTINGKCGLKIIESDGFDASLSNFYYKIGFLVDDTVININLPIFPYNAFREVDDMWKSFGVDLTNQACDTACYEKEVKYLKSFNVNGSVEKAVAKTYDQIISTIRFVKQINVSVSFPNSKLYPNMIDCSKVFEVNRTIAETLAVGKAALEELFKGPTDQEKKDGYFTNIPIGVKIQKLTIENGVAKVDLSKELEQGVGGSCRVDSIRAEITETLKQFSTVQSVIISIDGKTEDILQP